MQHINQTKIKTESKLKKKYFKKLLESSKYNNLIL